MIKFVSLLCFPLGPPIISTETQNLSAMVQPDTHLNMKVRPEASLKSGLKQEKNISFAKKNKRKQDHKMSNKNMPFYAR